MLLAGRCLLMPGVALAEEQYEDVYSEGSTKKPVFVFELLWDLSKPKSGDKIYEGLEQGTGTELGGKIYLLNPAKSAYLYLGYAVGSIELPHAAGGGQTEIDQSSVEFGVAYKVGSGAMDNFFAIGLGISSATHKNPLPAFTATFPENKSLRATRMYGGFHGSIKYGISYRLGIFWDVIEKKNRWGENKIQGDLLKLSAGIGYRFAL